ncbi:MAG: hypothetical protein KDA80_17680, partial [Planctomycetaceae bacterium]|nr:hypothetical protein [Planctomycetaceae bacterium]
VGLRAWSQRLSPVEQRLVGSWMVARSELNTPVMQQWEFSADRTFRSTEYQWDPVERKWMKSSPNYVYNKGSWKIEGNLLSFRGERPAGQKLYSSAIRLYNQLTGRTAFDPFIDHGTLKVQDDGSLLFRFWWESKNDYGPPITLVRGTIDDVRRRPEDFPPD